MSNCSYFKIHKGKVTCEHPEKGKMYSRAGNIGTQCDRCRNLCGGIYPSQVPYADQKDWKQDVVDSMGNVIE